MIKSVKPKLSESVVQGQIKQYDPILQILNSIRTGWMAEHRVCLKRRWRFDYAHPALKIAIEIEGGIYSGGRHTRGKGFINDMEKYNVAIIDGWKLLRYTPQQIPDALRDLKIILDKS